MNPLRHIRKNVFGVTQAKFAALVGVTQATVSRWENGISLDLTDMQAIRRAALARDLPWEDAWFFEIPEAGECRSALARPKVKEPAE